MRIFDLDNAVRKARELDEHHVGYFDVNGQVLRIVVPTSDIIEKLRSFFYPYIPSADGRCSVDSHYDFTVVSDSELYGNLKKRLPASPDALIATTLSHNVEYQLRYFHAELGNVSIVEDEPLKLFYLILKHERETRIVSTDGSRTRTGLLRLLRGYWILHALADHNSLIVHGCVLEKSGHGIVISGEKYAGKTTSLLNLCSRMNYNIVANDRLLLRFNQSNEKVSAVGVPTVVSLRQNTVKPFPQLHHLLDTPLFGVWDLARALNVNIRREVAVSAFVFLSYNAACRQPVFRLLEPEDAYQELVPQLFSFGEYDYVRKVGALETVSDYHDEVPKHILSGVSCFQLSCNETHLETLAHLMDDWCQSSRR